MTFFTFFDIKNNREALYLHVSVAVKFMRLEPLIDLAQIF